MAGAGDEALATPPSGPGQGLRELVNPDPTLVPGPGAETAKCRLNRSRGRRVTATQAGSGSEEGRGLGARGLLRRTGNARLGQPVS